MWHLFLMVLLLSALSFGGASILMAGLEREFVQEGMLTAEQFAGAVALGQSTPGPLAAFTTAIGMAVGGFSGALVATAAMVIVSLGMVLLISLVPSQWFTAPLAVAATRPLGPLTTALILFMAFRIVTAISPTLVGVSMSAGVVLARMYGLPTPLLMAFAVVAGMLVW